MRARREGKLADFVRAGEHEVVERLATLHAPTLDARVEGIVQCGECRRRDLLDRHDLRLVETRTSGQAQDSALVEVQAIIRDQIHAARACVDGIREEAATADTRLAIRGEEVTHGNLQQIFRQDHTIIDVDAVIVGRDAQRAHGLQRDAAADIPALLCRERLGAEQLCGAARDRERADLERDAVDEVRRGSREVTLLQRRGTETRGVATAHGKLLDRCESCRDLAGGLATEIAVVLVTHRAADQQHRCQVGLDISIQRRVVAGGIRLVGRTEARKHLRTRGGKAHGRIAAGIENRHLAVLPRTWLALPDLILILAPLRAAGQANRH